MRNAQKSRLVRMVAAVLVSGTIALGLMLVASTSASAVTGSTYSQAQCHVKGAQHTGTMWHRAVYWESYKCVKSSGSGWRLNVYGLSPQTAGTYFRGAIYPTESACEYAGAGMKGTYKGKSVTWKRWTCNELVDGTVRLHIDQLS